LLLLIITYKEDHGLPATMALTGIFCADVPLRNYSLTHVTSHPTQVNVPPP